MTLVYDVHFAKFGRMLQKCRAQWPLSRHMSLRAYKDMKNEIIARRQLYMFLHKNYTDDLKDVC